MSNPETWTAALFYVCAAFAVLSAVVVVAQRNPTYSAFGLIGTLISLAGIFGLLGSPFIAALQVIVYAGAIMVLFLFVMMLLAVQPEERARPGRVLPLVGAVLALVLCAEVGWVVLRAVPRGLGNGHYVNTEEMARVLFSTQYLYVFEATSILILAALLGAVALAKKDL